ARRRPRGDEQPAAAGAAAAPPHRPARREPARQRRDAPAEAGRTGARRHHPRRGGAAAGGGRRGPHRGAWEPNGCARARPKGGLECRAGDEATRALLVALDDAPTRAAVLAERAFLRGLGGGCLVPIGALGEVSGDRLHLRGAVLPTDGSQRIAGEAFGPAAEAEAVGRRLADELLARGAGGLLSRREK